MKIQLHISKMLLKVFNESQQYFSYIMLVSFVGGRNWRTPRKTNDLWQITDTFFVCTP